MAKVIRSKQNNQRINDNQQLVIRCVDAYSNFLRVKKNEVSKETVGIYEQVGNRTILPAIGDINIYELTTNDIRKLIDDFASCHSVGGTNHLYRHLKAFINWVWREYEPPTRNPISNVKVKKPASPPKQGITQEEVDKLLDVVKQTNFPERDRCLVMLLCDTGLRRSSIVNLKWGDVNLNRCELVVHEKDQQFHIKTFGQATCKAIKKYLMCLTDVKPEDPFWLSLDGSQCFEPGLREVLRRLCKMAGIPEHQYHDFRRYYALTLYNQTHDIYVVSRALDHKGVEVTKRYLAIDDRESAEALRVYSPMDKRYGQTGVKVNRNRAYL